LERAKGTEPAIADFLCKSLIWIAQDRKAEKLEAIAAKPVTHGAVGGRQMK